MKHSFLIFLTLTISLLFETSIEAQTIYVKPVEALKLIFSSSQEIVSEKKDPTPGQKLALEKALGTPLLKSSWNFYVARSRGRIDGYALIDNEMGKTEPITFLTAITPQGEVKEVEILVYREPYGSEVHEKKFLKQYMGKTSKDPLRTGQDISNISGATISSRSVSQGVKRALFLWSTFYGK